MNETNLQKFSFATPEFARQPDFSLIVPCYCEEPFLRRNVLELVSILGLTRLNFEFVFVEDASPDGTRKVLSDLAPELERLGVSHKILFHEKNRGRGAAVKSGVRAASGKIAGFIDIDLENMPSAILPMYTRIRDGELDLVVGRRVKSYSDFNLLRRITHLGYKWLIHQVIALPVSDTETGLKLFDREKIFALLDRTRNDHWFWDTEVVLTAANAGLKVGEYPVIFLRDHQKQSTVKVFRDSYLYLRALAAYARAERRASRPPLRRPARPEVRSDA